MLKLIIAHIIAGGTFFIMGCNVALAWNAVSVTPLKSCTGKNIMKKPWHK
ncbi:hypothetical protein ABVL48_004541 [Salmonella enterica]